MLRLVESEFDFELGGCYHVAAVYDQKVGRIYINGQLDVEENREGFTGDVAVSDENLKIGYWFSPYRDVHESFFGQVDEIRIFNIARTHQEILSTMNRPLTGGEEGLVGYWNFDSGTANDKSKFGNHGRLKGNAQIVAASIPNFTP